MKTLISNLRWSWLLLLAALYVGASGCQSVNGPPPGNLASITITNRAMADVTQAIAGVFASHGFEGGQTGPSQFVYHRLGTRVNDLGYGSYTFEEMDTVKVQVNLTQPTPNTILVGCRAWLAEGDNDPTFGDGPMIRPLRKWPYNQVLQDIRTELGE
jgi:hypothetical protein